MPGAFRNVGGCLAECPSGLEVVWWEVLSSDWKVNSNQNTLFLQHRLGVVGLRLLVCDDAKRGGAGYEELQTRFPCTVCGLVREGKVRGSIAPKLGGVQIISYNQADCMQSCYFVWVSNPTTPDRFSELHHPPDVNSTCSCTCSDTQIMRAYIFMHSAMMMIRCHAVERGNTEVWKCIGWAEEAGT